MSERKCYSKYEKMEGQYQKKLISNKPKKKKIRVMLPINIKCELCFNKIPTGKKLNAIKEGELNVQRKKIANFDEEQAELISARIIQKITNHFANHLKDDETMVDESIEWIEKVFQIETLTK
jgi:ribosomal protein S15P/S13E